MTRAGWILLLWLSCGALSRAAVGDLLQVPGGTFQPLYAVKGPAKSIDVPVNSFYLARYPVTNRQFLAFVRTHPEWRRSRVSRLFCEPAYLHHWNGDLDFDPALADCPVTFVSWFAARAYCKAQKRRLPTVFEWEYAGRASEDSPNGVRQAAFKQRILSWYGRPTPTRPSPVGSTFRNVYGIYDMHGLVWEWVEDFNTLLTTGESRGDSDVDRSLFCAAGVTGSVDPTDYAAYMRYSFRASLKARFTLANLGFRCAASER